MAATQREKEGEGEEGERKGWEEEDDEGNLAILKKKNYSKNLTELTAVAKKDNVCEM